jgi:hypothetical protein
MSGSLDRLMWTFFKDGKLPERVMQLANFSSATAGSGLTITRSRTAAMRVYADDNGADLFGTGSVPDIRTGLSRLLITHDQTGGNVRLFGHQGQLKGYNAGWNNEMASGLHGYVELVRASGTLTLGGYGVTSGVSGVVATSGTMTINTNHIVAGVSAISQMRSTGLTQTGSSAGFYCGIYDATNWSTADARALWKYGLLIANSAATTGIYVGTSTTGINIGGTCTTGLTIGTGSTTAIALGTGAVINYNSGNLLLTHSAGALTVSGGRLAVTTMPTVHTASSLSVGVYGTPIVDTTLVDNILFSANFSTATNKTVADTSCMAAYIGVSNTAATTNNKIQGLLVSNSLGYNCFDAYAVQGHTTIGAGGVSTQNANAHITGLSGKVNLGGAVGQGWVTGVLAILEGAGAVTGMCHALSAQIEAGVTAADSVILVGNDGTACPGITFAGSFTNAIEITAASSVGIHMHPFDGYAMYLGDWDASVVGNGWALGQSGHGRSVFISNSDGGVDPTRTITAVHSRFGVTKDYTDTFSTTALIGEYWNNGFDIVATSDNCNMSGVYGYMEVTTGGNAQIGGASGKIIYLAGLESWVELGADVELLATGKACGIKLSNKFKAGWAIGTGHTYAIYAETVDTAGFEYFFGTNHVGNGIEAATSNMGVAATAWALKIDVNGTPGYIPVYDNNTWS